jgi:DNA polymerase I
MESKPKILIVDGFNLFYQMFAVYKASDKNGEPVGGFVGFINNLQRLITKFTPQKVVVVFDGPSAGERRRQVFRDYKGKRARKKRYSIFDHGDGDKEEVDNEQQQLISVYNALKHLPVEVYMLPFYEADDIIAYLCDKNPEYTKIISSNDRDYYQLINADTFVWAAQKKILYSRDIVEAEYKVLCENFLYMRTITGDTSDKLIGVKGVGTKTLLEKLPSISTQAFHSFEEFWNAIEEIDAGKSKTLQKLKESKSEALTMYKLMRLDYTCLNLRAIELLERQVEEQTIKPFSKINFKRYCIKEGLEQHIKNFDLWVRPFLFLKQDIKLNT